MGMSIEMKSTHLIIALGIIGAAGTLHASTFSFSTPTGAKDLAGNPVSVTAIFVVSGNQLQITVENNTKNPVDAGQILDAMTFELKNQTLPTGASIYFSGSLSEAININSNGSYSPVGTCNGGSNQSGCYQIAENWTGTDTITGSGSNSTIQFVMCDANVTAAGCPSKTAQTYANEAGIIGGPSSSNTYTSSGIKASPANPYIFESATLYLTLSSGTFNTYATAYSNVLFGFGNSTATYDAIAGVAPEPSSFGMMAAALILGLAGYKFRHKLSAKQ
jgi:hypothetical protein